MAEEIGLADLETAQKNLAQKLSAHVKKREAFELKFQEEITSVATNINGKLDDLIKSLDSIQLQLFSFGKGKMVDDVGEVGPIAGGSSGSMLEEICNKSQQSPGKGLQIEQNDEETLKQVSQERDNDRIVLSELLPSDESLDKLTPLSLSNIKNNDDSTLGFPCPEALKRRDRIGVPFSVKKETKCKFSQSPLKIVMPRLNRGFYVVFNSAGKWGLSTTTFFEIDLGKNIGLNRSYSPKLCLNESFAEREIHVEKFVEEKINICAMLICHVDSVMSTTTGHFTYKFGSGSVDKRFIERFKTTEMNKRSFKYVLVLDELKIEKKLKNMKRIEAMEYLPLNIFCGELQQNMILRLIYKSFMKKCIDLFIVIGENEEGYNNGITANFRNKGKPVEFIRLGSTKF